MYLLGPEDLEKFFFRIQHRPTTLELPAAVCRILDSCGLAAIFSGLEPAGLRNLAHFAGESSGDASH
jgi:hypothetical protein